MVLKNIFKGLVIGTTVLGVFFACLTSYELGVKEGNKNQQLQILKLEQEVLKLKQNTSQNGKDRLEGDSSLFSPKGSPSSKPKEKFVGTLKYIVRNCETIPNGDGRCSLLIRNVGTTDVMAKTCKAAKIWDNRGKILISEFIYFGSKKISYDQNKCLSESVPAGASLKAVFSFDELYGNSSTIIDVLEISCGIDCTLRFHKLRHS